VPHLSASLREAGFEDVREVRPFTSSFAIVSGTAPGAASAPPS